MVIYVFMAYCTFYFAIHTTAFDPVTAIINVPLSFSNKFRLHSLLMMLVESQYFSPEMISI